MFPSYLRGKFLFSLFLTLSCCFSWLPAAQQPVVAELVQEDAMQLMQTMLALHATFHDLNEELVGRIIKTFPEQIDPAKIYYLREDVQELLTPSKKTLKRVQRELESGDFSSLQKIFARVPKRVERTRKMIENIREQAPECPEDAPSSLPSERDWLNNEEELQRELEEIYFAQKCAISRLPEGESRKREWRRIDRVQQEYERFITPSENTLSYQHTFFTLFMQAFAKSLDAHTKFLTPWEAKRFSIDFRRSLCGIGVVLQCEENGLKVTKILDNGPAAKLPQLKEGDYILEVDGQSVVNMDAEEALELVRGPAGTVAQLTFLRPSDDPKGEIRQASYVREEILFEKERVKCTISECKGGAILSLKTHAFYEDDHSSLYEDMLKASTKLLREHRVKGVILDMRDNPGGLLHQAVKVAGLFLRRGIVLSVKNEQGEIQHLRNIDSQRIWDGPLVVLVNRRTCSAAEILAQSLKDWGRALVVGDDRTSGKGCFQSSTIDAKSNSEPNKKGEMNITRGRFYLPSGRSPQIDGVESDIEFGGAHRYTKFGERFLLYPLSSDTIAPNYTDRFDDVPFYQRAFACGIYSSDRQVVTDEWRRALPLMKRRSEARVLQNSEYQGFLRKTYCYGDDGEKRLLRTRQEREEKYQFFDDLQNNRIEDFQFTEAVNVLCDLICLRAGHSLPEEDNSSGERCSAMREVVVEK